VSIDICSGAAGLRLGFFLIFVMALDEAQRAGLVATLRRPVEDHQRREDFLAAAGIVRIGMVDSARLVADEGAHAGQLVMGLLARQWTKIIKDLAALKFLGGEGDVIIEIEIAAE